MLFTTGLTPLRSQFPARHGDGVGDIERFVLDILQACLGLELQSERINLGVGVKGYRHRHVDLHAQNRQGEYLRFQVNGQRRCRKR